MTKRPVLKSIIILIGLIVIIWFAGLLYFTTVVLSAHQEQIYQKTDAIIVLTGGKKRINTGLKLLSDEVSEYLFISGVNENVHLAKIKEMHVDGYKLPECCIDMGFMAKNTMDNAAETRSWLEEKGFNSIRLVTSDYHIARSMLEFRHVMPSLEIIKHPIREYSLNHRKYWKNIFIEYNKTIVTWLRQRAGVF